MVEFLVALAVLLPLFLAVTYAGRYGDIQNSAIQASRYAAFQRAMQPSTAVLSNDRIQDQMRARFFVHGRFLNQGQIRSDDSVANINQNSNSAPPLWRDLSLNPLLTQPQQVQLTFAPVSLGATQSTLDLMVATAGKSFNGGSVARVEMNVLNRMDLRTQSPANLSIGAATAAAGDALSSSGSAATRSAASTAVASAIIPGAVSGFIQEAFGLFEADGPEFGCMRPDPVPAHRLEGSGNAAGGC